MSCKLKYKAQPFDVSDFIQMVRFDIFSNGDRVFERIDVEYSGRSLPALHIYLGKLYIYDCVYPSGVSIRNRDPAFYFSTDS